MRRDWAARSLAFPFAAFAGICPTPRVGRFELETAMADKTPPVTNPSADVGEYLALVVGETGTLQEAMGGYRIAVHHTGAFPWDEVFKVLLYRDFRVFVTRRKADLFIEAQP
jgi:hypothetical protein